MIGEEWLEVRSPYGLQWFRAGPTEEIKAPIKVARVHLDTWGYARGGKRYYGLGLPVYRFDGPGVFGRLRAATYQEARGKVKRMFPKARVER